MWYNRIHDAAGNNVANIASHIANINPFRYRSYYYDAEIAKYYLQSRYYDPAVGRFINGDDLNFILNSKTPQDFNYYSYCAIVAASQCQIKTGTLSIKKQKD